MVGTLSVVPHRTGKRNGRERKATDHFVQDGSISDMETVARLDLTRTLDCKFVISGTIMDVFGRSPIRYPGSTAKGTHLAPYRRAGLGWRLMTF